MEEFDLNNPEQYVDRFKSFALSRCKDRIVDILLAEDEDRHYPLEVK